MIRINQIAPDFTAESTKGTIHFHDYIAGKWCLLSSHPADFTPVCSTEIKTMSCIKDELDKRNVLPLELSIDTLEDHEGWSKAIKEEFGVVVNYPLIADPHGEIAAKYGMIDVNTNKLMTNRSVFIINPEKIIMFMCVYPASCGRNFDEFIRVIDSLQLTYYRGVGTRANWKAGNDVIIDLTMTEDDAVNNFPTHTVVSKDMRMKTVPYADVNTVYDYKPHKQ